MTAPELETELPSLTYIDLQDLDRLLWALYDGTRDPDLQVDILRHTGKLAGLLGEMEPGDFVELAEAEALGAYRLQTAAPATAAPPGKATGRSSPPSTALRPEH